MTHDDMPYIKHMMDAINDIEASVRNMSKGQFKSADSTALKQWWSGI